MSDKYWIEYLESKSPVNYVDYLESNLAARDRRIAELDAENQRLRVALDRYRGQIDRFGTESAGEALQEQEK